jgi:hypothetical protein
VAADRIHIAEPNPPYCSSCFTQKPRSTHVDFGAFYDGPVIKSEEGLILHQIDDLVICEQCLVIAGRLIGLGFVEKVADELRKAESENDDLMEQIRGLKAYIEKREEAFGMREGLHIGNGGSKPAKRKAAA